MSDGDPLTALVCAGALAALLVLVVWHEWAGPALRRRFGGRQ